MENNKYKHFVSDLSSQLIEKALLAKKNAYAESSEDKFALGYLMAFHEVIDLIKQEARTFDVPEKELGLHNIDPDVELL